MKVTKKYLEGRILTLNIALHRPISAMDGKDSSMLFKMNVGHLSLHKNEKGYRLVETTSICGNERDWSDRMSAGEMAQFISGVINGITLHHIHISATLTQNEPKQADKTPAVAADAVTATLHELMPIQSGTFSVDDNLLVDNGVERPLPAKPIWGEPLIPCKHEFKFMRHGHYSRYDVYVCEKCQASDIRSWGY